MALGPDGIAFVYINQEILRFENPFIGWAGMKNKLITRHINLICR